MAKRSLPLSRVYRLLEPGPVVLVSTSILGRANVMSMSWHTMLEFEPPLVGCVISNRNFTFDILRTTKECVLNIPTAALLKKTVGVGNTTGKKIDKLAHFGLTTRPGSRVKAPLLEACYANLECRVVDTRLVEKYNFFILEVVKAWIDPRENNPRTIHHRGHGVFMLAGKTVKVPSKMK